MTGSAALDADRPSRPPAFEVCRCLRVKKRKSKEKSVRHATATAFRGMISSHPDMKRISTRSADEARTISTRSPMRPHSASRDPASGNLVRCDPLMINGLPVSSNRTTPSSRRIASATNFTAVIDRPLRSGRSGRSTDTSLSFGVSESCARGSTIVDDPR